MRWLFALARAVSFVSLMAFAVLTVKLPDRTAPGSMSSYRSAARLTILDIFDLGVEVELPWIVLFSSSMPARFVISTMVMAWLEVQYGKLRARRSPRELRSTDVVEVLYLREFRTDEAPRSFRTKKYAGVLTVGDDDVDTFDASICQAFSRVGRVGALVPRQTERGPRVHIPTGPDELLVVADETWQAEVERLMQHARAVLLVVGKGSNISWELVTALRLVPRERFALIFLPRSVHDFWIDVRDELRRSGIDAPDAPPSGARVLLFENQKLKIFEGRLAPHLAASELERAIAKKRSVIGSSDLAATTADTSSERRDQ